MWRHWIVISAFTGFQTAFSLSSGYAQEGRGEVKPTFQPFLWIQASFVNGETSREPSTFQLKRSRFGTKGIAYGRVGYHFMMEGVVNGKDPRVLQTWIDYRVHSLASFRVGQFKYPFGIEAYPSFVTWKFINPSFVTGGIVKELGRKSVGQNSGLFRDTGVQCEGRFEIGSEYAVGYKTMVMNGNGILQSDNNDEKDLVLRGSLTAPLGVQVGASYFKGTFESDVDGAALDESAVGVDLTWRNEVQGQTFRIQGEYVSGRYKTPGKDIDPQGFYLYGTILLAPRVEVGLRYDWFEPNRNEVEPIERERTTLGMAYQFHKDQRISINYEVVNDDLKQVDNVFTAQFQSVF